MTIKLVHVPFGSQVTAAAEKARLATGFPKLEPKKPIKTKTTHK
jgi:hypothetical protein